VVVEEDVLWVGSSRGRKRNDERERRETTLWRMREEGREDGLNEGGALVD
jgi:hypothetical protein